MVLWLFVLALGTAFGAGLYEHRILVPEWIGPDATGEVRWDADAAATADTGRRFWAFVTTGPLTLLTMASIWIAWRMRGPGRRLWMGAACTAFAERALTFGYFIPTMMSLLAVPDSPEAVATATTWAALNHLRHVLVLIAWLQALVAFRQL